MRYFVAHLLTGHVRSYHERLTEELARRYHIEPLSEQVPAHVTLKIPFDGDADQAREIERTLRAYARMAKKPLLRFIGFGHFGFKTIYLNGEGDDASSFMRRCLQLLRTNHPWLPQPPLEGNKLHASVARFLTRRTFGRIWKDVRDLKPRFESLIDNLAILKHDGGIWKVESLIPVGGGTVGVTTPTFEADDLVRYSV